MNGKQTQERRFMWACSVAAIVLCCSCAVLCAVCMQLGAGRILLCAAVLPVCSCAPVCSAACVALLCCALCCMAVLCHAVLCAYVVFQCAQLCCALLVRRAWREALLCAALPCCALLCSAVRWNGRDMNGKQTQQKRFIWLAKGTSQHRTRTKYSQNQEIWVQF